MDFEGWEVLPEDEYPEIHYDGSQKIFSGKYGADDSHNLYKNKYFFDPSEFVESTEKSRTWVPKQLLPAPIHLSPSPDEDLEKTKGVLDSGIPLEADHDPVSQVSFKKMNENKSVDIKLGSPKSNNKDFIPQMDPGTFQFENKENPIKDEALEDKNLLQKPENEKTMEIKKEINDEATWGEDSGGVNIFKWSLNGFGAICSFGVVAASICIIILGGRKQTKQQNQKVQFHIFAEDKRIKQVVHHATRLNEAIATMRGVPTGVRAHITVGGYYEGL